MEPSRPSNAIARLEAWRVAFPVVDRSGGAAGDGDPFNAASPSYTRIESLMIRVTDTDGATGWGEAFGHKANPTTMAALRSAVSEFGLGATTEPEAFTGAATFALSPFGRGGPIAFAISGVDTALWDIRTRRAGLPLSRLLNPEAAATVDCYSSLPSFEGVPADITAAVSRMAERGFTRLKLHEKTGAATRIAMDAAPGMRIATDMNGFHPAAEAATVADDFSDVGLWFAEEALYPFSDMRAAKVLRDAGIPTAAGENAADADDLLAAAASGALSFVQPSVGKIGGVSAIERIHREVPDGVTVIPHCYYYGPALFATAHLIAAHPGEHALLETPHFDWEATLHDRQTAGPSFTLPEAPGLGFDPDPRDFADFVVDSLDVHA